MSAWTAETRGIAVHENSQFWRQEQDRNVIIFEIAANGHKTSHVASDEQFRALVGLTEEPELPTPPFGQENIARLDRVEKLYEKLPENDRYYIVSKWDEEQGLEPPDRRLHDKRSAPERASRRKRWAIIAFIPAFFIWKWVAGLVRAEQEYQKDSFIVDYLRERSEKDPIIKGAIADAERAYRDLLNDLRPEPE